VTDKVGTRLDHPDGMALLPVAERKKWQEKLGQPQMDRFLPPGADGADLGGDLCYVLQIPDPVFVTNEIRAFLSEF